MKCYIAAVMSVTLIKGDASVNSFTCDILVKQCTYFISIQQVLNPVISMYGYFYFIISHRYFFEPKFGKLVFKDKYILTKQIQQAFFA